MLALMGGQIHSRQCLLEEDENRRFQPGSITSQRQHRAMVRGIRRHVEHTDTGRAAHRRRDRRHDVGTPPFADVRNALDDRHGTS